MLSAEITEEEAKSGATRGTFMVLLIKSDSLGMLTPPTAQPRFTSERKHSKGYK